MRPNNVLGILYASSYEKAVTDLSFHRTMGSIPFGGRYRIVDFMLSAMVNAGLRHIFMPTKRNYRSLMDHIGNGKQWDLARKREGIVILPPFSSSESDGVYENRVDALQGIAGFIKEDGKDYVLIADSNLIANPDLGGMLKEHTKTGADITIAAVKGTTPMLKNTMLIEYGEDMRVRKCEVLDGKTSEQGYWSPHILLMKKSLLLDFINCVETSSEGYFERELIKSQLGNLKIYAWEMPNFLAAIDSIRTYYNANMALLEKPNRDMLFDPQRPVHTKVRDEAPSVYSSDVRVKNCLIADGCVLRGSAENSLLYRGVKVGKGSTIRNSVIMQDCVIGDGVILDGVILDKHVSIADGAAIKTRPPYYVGKGVRV